jgi:hypothetical protein
MNTTFGPSSAIPLPGVTTSPTVRVLCGTVVAANGKMLYVDFSGIVVPLDAKRLIFRQNIGPGQEIRASFEIQDHTRNVAQRIWDAGPNPPADDLAVPAMQDFADREGATH